MSTLIPIAFKFALMTAACSRQRVIAAGAEDGGAVMAVGELSGAGEVGDGRVDVELLVARHLRVAGTWSVGRSGSSHPVTSAWRSIA